MNNKKEFNPVLVAFAFGIGMFLWNIFWTFVAVGVENTVQTWAGFAMLSFAVIFLAPIAVAVAAYCRADLHPARWGIGGLVCAFVWNVVWTLIALAVENYVQSWLGFSMLTFGVIVLTPFATSVAGYFLTLRINEMNARADTQSEERENVQNLAEEETK